MRSVRPSRLRLKDCRFLGSRAGVLEYFRKFQPSAGAGILKICNFPRLTYRVRPHAMSAHAPNPPCGDGCAVGSLSFRISFSFAKPSGSNTATVTGSPLQQPSDVKSSSKPSFIGGINFHLWSWPTVGSLHYLFLRRSQLDRNP